MPIEKIEPVTLDVLRAAKMQFEKTVGMINAVEAILETERKSEVWVFRVASLEKAVDRARAFTNELERSLHAMVAKKPLGPDAKKVGRPTKAQKKGPKK